MALYEENLKNGQFWIKYLRNNSVTYYQLSETNKKTLDSIRECLKYYNETVECPVCHGLGSEEAYKDQVMQEALEDFADKYGAFVNSGEGDLCDMFVSIVVDEDEDMEME